MTSYDITPIDQTCTCTITYNPASTSYTETTISGGYGSFRYELQKALAELEEKQKVKSHLAEHKNYPCKKSIGKPIVLKRFNRNR